MAHPDYEAGGDYEAVIGLEVHVQLLTETKMFCRCPNRFGAPPNTLVCPVCLGYPGTLPVPNRHAVDLAVRLALALGFEVRETSVFARKNYFYPDLPKGYQISQFDRPLAEDGAVPLAQHDKAVQPRAPAPRGGRRQAAPRGAGGRRAAGAEPGRLQPLRRAAGRDRLAAGHGERRRGAGLSPDPAPAPALHRRRATATWRRGACAATPTSRCAAAARRSSAPRPRSRTSTPSATWRGRSSTRSSARPR